MRHNDLERRGPERYVVDESIELTIKIPKRLLREVVAEALREQASAESSLLAPREPEATLRPWNEPEIKRQHTWERKSNGEYTMISEPPYDEVPSVSSDAFNLFLQTSPRALEPLQYLVNRPGQRVSGDELVHVLGVSPSELTGSLSSIRKRSDALRRAMPIQYRPGPKGGTYLLDRDVAQVFESALDMIRLTWPEEEAYEVVGELADNTSQLLNLFLRRQRLRAELRLLEEAGADESLNEVAGFLSAANEMYSELSRKRAALLRKYDPQSADDLPRAEESHKDPQVVASQQEGR
jgi:hypothetical protein